eukprot:scaffold35246_cov200-Skeletonema_dohrnii-CCMP3373.AAC.1
MSVIITMIRMVTGTHEALDICGRFVVQNTKLAGNRFRRITDRTLSRPSLKLINISLDEMNKTAMMKKGGV